MMMMVMIIVVVVVVRYVAATTSTDFRDGICHCNPGKQGRYCNQSESVGC